MKRIVSVVTAVLLLVLCASCEYRGIEPLEEVSVESANAEILSSQIGIEMSIPETAKNVKCAIINDLIGETEFVYESIIFVHRASKVYSGPALYGETEKIVSTEEITVNDGLTAELSVLNDGGRLVLWYENGNHHSLFTSKIVGTDMLTEILKCI